MPAQSLDQVVSLCKRRGFIFPGSEIYGGLANSWDYGPLGSKLKRKLKADWIRTFVDSRTDMEELDSGILMNSKVWEASGHIGSFVDLISTCKFCKKHVRMDHWDELIENSEWFKSLRNKYLSGSVSLEDLKKWGEKEAKKLAPNLAIVRNPSVTITWLAEYMESLQPFIQDDTIIQSSMRELVKYLATEQLARDGLQTPCPYCGGELVEPKHFNLLFKTHQGVVEDEGTLVYMRPETAQGIFVNFKNIFQTSRQRLPFGIAQIGKAFRNEVTPGNFIYRTREFEQMEIEYFVEEKDAKKTFDKWQKLVWDWYVSLGISEKRLRVREHDKDELSHYSSRTIDIEYEFPWGWGELCGLADRGTFDLSQHEKFSKQDLAYTDPTDSSKKFLPNVIEPSFGVDRTMLTLLIEALTEDEAPSAKGGIDKRTVLKLNPKVAPYDCAILPLSKSEKLISKAEEIYRMLLVETKMSVDFDITGSIGKRYRRQDEIGTPKCVTVDFGTIGDDTEQCKKDCVTVRDRDSLGQEEVGIGDLVGVLK